MSDKVNITPEQRACIYHDKGNMIVSASAGSGKTFVVIERIIRLVADMGVGVDKILAVTFTKLAANEMKEKLKKALIDKFNETGDLRLKRELAKVSGASISTIHSFLGDLLRKFFYVIGLDSNFEILDEKKAKKFSIKAIDELFSELYEKADTDFLNLLSIYSSKRNDSKLKKLVLDIYHFSESELSLEELRRKSLKLQNNALKYARFYAGLIDELSPEEIDTEEQNCSVINALINLTKKFKEKYELLKREENYVDFYDLEALVLELFKNTEILNDVKNSYKYIFVDEYQDVNLVQEEIINLLGNDNLFMVGDSKQSIYGFRGCNPKFFSEKFEKYSNGEGGIAVNLNSNFRSTKSVIEYVNTVFSRVMQRKTCGFDYSNNPMVYGANYGEYEGKTQIHLVEGDSKQENVEHDFIGAYSVIESSNKQKEKKYSNEALYIVKLISDLLATKHYDAKEGVYKQTTCKDICILLRSIKGAEEWLVQTLLDYGIPVSSGAKNSISSYPEIKVMYSLVESICSLENDVALATVMLNFKDFTENELALIRKIGGRGVKFFECLQCARAFSGNQELAKKVDDFILWFDKIRLVSEYQSAEEVLRKVIKETNFDIKLKLKVHGNAKVNRIERFISESNLGDKKLTILEFYDYLLDAFEEISVVESEGEETVKIMTAHSSKGLEFPIVIVAGINKLFNSKDKGEEVLMDREFGLAPKSYNIENMTILNNPARQFLKNRYNEIRAIEEARLLYVELTRAKCEMHIIAKKGLKENVDVQDFINATSQDNYLSASDTSNVIEVSKEELKPIIFKSTLLQDGKNLKDNFVVGNETDPFITKVLKENLTFKYPYVTETTMPVKQSVSELNDTEEYYKVTNLFGTSSSEKGTAYHRFFELSSFDIDKVDIELNEFVKNGLITKEQFELLDATKIKSILKMDVFTKIKGKTIYKEQKFCSTIKAREIGYDSDEDVLIQGIIDVLVIEDDGVWILDYKLSTIESEEDLIKAYKKQMYLYKNAVEKVLNVKVKKVTLINILQEKIVNINV